MQLVPAARAAVLASLGPRVPLVLVGNLVPRVLRVTPEGRVPVDPLATPSRVLPAPWDPWVLWALWVLPVFLARRGPTVPWVPPAPRCVCVSCMFGVLVFVYVYVCVCVWMYYIVDVCMRVSEFADSCCYCEGAR